MAEEAVELIFEGMDKVLDTHFEKGWDKVAEMNRKRKEKKQGRKDDSSTKRGSKEDRDSRDNGSRRTPTEDNRDRRAPRDDLTQSRSRTNRDSDRRYGSINERDRGNPPPRRSNGGSGGIQREGKARADLGMTNTPRREPSAPTDGLGPTRSLREDDRERLRRRERGYSADYDAPWDRERNYDDSQRRRGGSIDRYQRRSNPTNDGRRRRP